MKADGKSERHELLLRIQTDPGILEVTGSST